MRNLCYLLCFLPTFLLAQEPTFKKDTVQKTVRIGEKVPSDAIGITIEGKEIGSVSQLPEELVILDFMNTSCTSCIAALPRLNKVEQENKGRLKIISISDEKKNRAEAFRAHNEVFKANKLDYVVEDKVWSSYFPHQTVSHMVWIYKGKVVAITYSEFVDQAMVNKVFDKGIIEFPIKDDYLVFDYGIPLMKNQKGKYSFLTGYIEGAYSKFSQEVDSAQREVREYIVNADIVPAFLYCYGKTTELPYMKDSRIMIDRFDKERFIFEREKSGYQQIWNQKYAVSYEANFDLELDEKRRMLAMIRDLELKLGVKTFIESRRVRCWVIKDEGRQVGKSDHNGQAIDDFAFMLDLNADRPPVVNESKNLNKYMFKGQSDFIELQRSLKEFGFLLTEEDREIPCFVIQ
ncbi:TlpA family protein disulfide reductase [Sphingobacterium sp. MYb388]|uniref:TlpA family protein disulfide reductase n=1 Tax=Sphingobacterium sp. MYb388 TaxID=2745437 RepID=UPI0030A2F2D2